MEMVFGMEVSFELSVPCFKEIQVSLKMRVFPVELCPKNCRAQGGYIFYAGGRLAGAGYCRLCRRRPAILLLQLWQGCQVCVKISAQRPPKVAQFNAR